MQLERTRRELRAERLELANTVMLKEAQQHFAGEPSEGEELCIGGADSTQGCQFACKIDVMECTQQKGQHAATP